MPTKPLIDDPYASLPRATAGLPVESDPYASLTRVPVRSLPEGVRIVGTNAAGQPIFGPAGVPMPAGGAARRFLTSAVAAIKGPVMGAYHAVIDEPRTPQEIATEGAGSRGALVVKRMLVDPTVAEGRKTAEEFRQGHWLSQNPTPEELRHRQLAAGHGLATAIPMLGPGVAQAAELIGTQAGSGDIAGAAGTLAGNVVLYAAPEGAGRVARSEMLSRALPHGEITRLIKPTAQDVKVGKDPARAILQEGITGNSLKQLGDRVYDRLHAVGREINAVAQAPANASKIVDVSVALQPLDDAMTKAVKAGDRKLYRKLEAARNEIYFDWQEHTTPNGQTVLRPVGPRSMRLSPFAALEFKRMIGDRVRWTGDGLDAPVNEALGAAYAKVKDAINGVVPDLKPLNQQYADLVGAASAITRRVPVAERNAHWSLSEIVLGSSGHPALAAAVKAARLPRVRTRVAKGLYNLPRLVPESPRVRAAATAPVIGAAQSSQQRLRELQAEAARRRPAGAAAAY